MNAELLREAARMPIDMTYWFQMKHCGTVSCLGGNIAILCGATPVWERDDLSDLAFMCMPENKSKPEWVIDFAVEQTGAPNTRLFKVGLWPRELREKLGIRLDGRNPSQEKIQAVVEDYIETGGWESKL